MDINDIIRAIEDGNVLITDHADEEAYNDNLRFNDIYYSVEHGKIIEEYPVDKPYPSCLIFGKNQENDPVHSVWALNENNGWAVIITVYRPDPNKWKNWIIRK